MRTMLQVVAELQEVAERGSDARADLRDELHGQVLESVRLGAKLALGGAIPDRPLADVVRLGECPEVPVTLLGALGQGVGERPEEHLLRLGGIAFLLALAAFLWTLATGRPVTRVTFGPRPWPGIFR